MVRADDSSLLGIQSSLDMYVRAMCASRCFRLQYEAADSDDRKFLDDNPKLSMPLCKNKTSNPCIMCLNGCKAASKHESCSQSCQLLAVQSTETLTCIQACQFVRIHRRYMSPGLCPHEQIPSKYSQLQNIANSNKSQLQSNPRCPINNICNGDSTCSALNPSAMTQSVSEKCCSPPACQGSSICQEAHFDSDVIPPVVNHLHVAMSHEQYNVNSPKIATRNVELDWTGYMNTLARHIKWHIVFVVEISLHAAEDSSSSYIEWRPLVWTSKDQAVLNELPIGSVLRCRVSAFNEYGYQGLGHVSRLLHVTSPTDEENTNNNEIDNRGEEDVNRGDILVPPSPPQNVRESRSRIQNDFVSLTVSWDPPLHSKGLTITKYEITWQQLYGAVGAGQASMTEYLAKTPESQREYTMERLQSQSQYKIEVRAIGVSSTHLIRPHAPFSTNSGNSAGSLGTIATGGDVKELRSKPATVYLKTPGIPERGVSSHSSYNSEDGNSPSSNGCSCERRSTMSPSILGKPFFEKNDLRMNLDLSKLLNSNQGVSGQIQITWSPRVCIESRQPSSIYDVHSQAQSGLSSQIGSSTSNTFNYGVVNPSHPRFQMTNLRFQCHYRLEVKLADGRVWSSCFCTPTCHDVHMVGESSEGMPCTTEQDLPNEPTDLSYTAQKRVSSDDLYDITVRWRQSREVFSGSSSLHSYRLRWGPRIDEPVEEKMYNFGLEPRMDARYSESKVLPKTVSNFTIRSLSGGQLYIVEIQSVSVKGDSSPQKSIFFTLPNKNVSTTEHDKTSTKPSGNNSYSPMKVNHRLLTITAVGLLIRLAFT